MNFGGRDGTRTRNLGINSAVVPSAFAACFLSFVSSGGQVNDETFDIFQECSPTGIPPE